MIETILAGAVGGISRLAPEVIKIFSRRGENKHELEMLKAEMEFAKLRGEINLKQTEASMTIQELNTIEAAFKEQSETASKGGWFVATLSAAVRPVVTYWFMGLYSAVKIATMIQGLGSGDNWKEVVIQNWNPEDMSLLTMILTFWFVGRVYERTKGSR